MYINIAPQVGAAAAVKACVSHAHQVLLGTVSISALQPSFALSCFIGRSAVQAVEVVYCVLLGLVGPVRHRPVVKIKSEHCRKRLPNSLQRTRKPS